MSRARGPRTHTLWESGMCVLFMDERMAKRIGRTDDTNDPQPPHWEVWYWEVWEWDAPLATYPDKGERARDILERYLRERDARPDHLEGQERPDGRQWMP